jgi:zinc-finger-containing domain
VTETKTEVICHYCGNPAELVDSEAVYPSGADYGPLWLCRPCGAYVGTHKNSKDHKPLGRLANAELRGMRKAAHRAFDPLWRSKMERDKMTKNAARAAAYRWLADQLELDKRACHIGDFDLDQCRKVVEVCTKPETRKPTKPKEETPCT